MAKNLLTYCIQDTLSSCVQADLISERSLKLAHDSIFFAYMIPHIMADFNDWIIVVYKIPYRRAPRLACL